MLTQIFLLMTSLAVYSTCLQMPEALSGLSGMDWFPNPVGGNSSVVYSSRFEPSSAKVKGSMMVVYVLLRGDTQTVFHRLKLNGLETINHVHGHPVKIYVINPANGNLTESILGPRQQDGFTLVVPQNHYIVSTLRHGHHSPGKYALMSVTLVQGIHFDKVDIPTREKLTALCGHHADIVRKFT